MPAEPNTVLKLCNCGACSRPVRSGDVMRRLELGVRYVPLCYDCGSKSDAECVALIKWQSERVGA